MLLLNGKNPAALKTSKKVYFTASANQTTFNVVDGYSVGDTEVYMNGVRLVDGDDFSATNGNDVILSFGANSGDSILVVSYNQFLTSASYTKAESDNKYLALTGGTLSSYLRTPNYGITSASDSSSASIEANPLLGTQGVAIKAHGRSVATNGGDIHYVTDTRGVGGGNHKFYSWNGSSLTENMKIDPSGRITLPNQVSFLYYSAGGSDVTYTTSQKINVYSSLGYNKSGGAYDSANSRFTAQIAGVYLFRAQAWVPPSSTIGGICFRVNGTTQIGEARVSKPTTGNYCSLNLVVHFYLNVNEYVEIWTGPDAGTVHISSGASYTGFSGHLLG